MLCLGQCPEPTAPPENETHPQGTSVPAGLPSARAQLYHWRWQGVTLKVAFNVTEMSISSVILMEGRETAIFKK